jgi:hypothetical protein
MTLRKNADPTLLATHTIDLKFSFADGAPITGVNDVEPKMHNLDSTASEALRSVKVKISDVYFLIALAKGDQAVSNSDDYKTLSGRIKRLKPIAKGLKVDLPRSLRGRGMAAICAFRPKAGVDDVEGRGSRRVDGAVSLFKGASTVVNRHGCVGFLSPQ